MCNRPDQAEDKKGEEQPSPPEAARGERLSKVQRTELTFFAVVRIEFFAARAFFHEGGILALDGKRSQDNFHG